MYELSQTPVDLPLSPVLYTVNDLVSRIKPQAYLPVFYTTSWILHLILYHLKSSDILPIYSISPELLLVLSREH